MDTTKAYRSALQCDTSPQTTWSVSGGSSWCPNLAIQQAALQRRSLGPHFLDRIILIHYHCSLAIYRRLLRLDLLPLTTYQRRQFFQLVPLVCDDFLLDAVRRPQRVVVLKNVGNFGLESREIASRSHGKIREVKSER